MKPAIRVLLCDESGQRFFGEGPCRLLHAIEETGSLRGAALSMGMAYTKALFLIRHAQDNLGFPLTEKTIGGKGGGGSRLTPQAKEFLQKYETYRDACCQANSRIYHEIFAGQTLLPVGCVVLASGLGKRFGSNKLMADFHGKPLAAHILSKIQPPLFRSRLAVTRHESVADLCRGLDFPVLLHSLPDRSDTVRLGLEQLLALDPDIKGCMFCPADQPLLSRDSLESLVQSFSRSPESILRLGWDGRPGSPVIFGRRYFQELLDLPKGRGGSFLAEKYPGQVQCVPARESWELCDIDTQQDLARMLEHMPHI